MRHIGPVVVSAILFVAGGIVAITAVGMQGGGSTGAASPSERECDAQGGTFERVQGQVSCVVVEEENVGNSENSQTTTTTTDTTGQGNIENKEEQTEECSGPGGSTSSAHCR